MADLIDKIALVSGGARGIGGAISEAMCAAGAKVVISDLLQEGENKASELTDKGYDAIDKVWAGLKGTLVDIWGNYTEGYTR